MIVAGSASPLLLSSAGGYNLTNSLRFRSSASAYLNRTPASAGNQKTWTYSTWIKRGAVSAEGTLISGGATTGRLCVFFNSSGNLVSDVGGTGTFDQSVAVYRDPSAWYHFVWQFDTTQATAANRSRMYINGSQISLTQTRTFALNTDYPINNSVLQTLGTFSNSIGTYNFDGYQAETNFIDGQALTPSSFGETSTTTGVWIPKKYTGTYGTNGFYLPFTDNSALTTSSNAGLGKDFSGNANYWTTNNISITSGSTYDSMTDVPTLTSATVANYCVMNPLTTGTATTLSGANLNLQQTSGSSVGNSRSSFAMITGKWYMEIILTSNSAGIYPQLGIMTSRDGSRPNNDYPQAGYSTSSLDPTLSVIYMADGTKQTNGSSSSYGSSFTNGDVIGVAIDSDNGAIYFSKNGTFQNSGVPTSGSSKTGAALTWTGGTVEHVISIAGYNNLTQSVNFGQRPFAYTPPTGFKALNTFNLPTPTIGATASTQANKYFDISLYSGTSSAQSITNSGGFQPDFVWGKARSTNRFNVLVDAVRGSSKDLYSNATNAENTDATVITGFNSNGFGLGTDAELNLSGNTFVAWQWKANGTGSSNTAGSITSTVSANTTAGFSIVTYTGTGANATVGHGLGVALAMMIIKTRSLSGENWWVWHQSLPTPTTSRILLNLTNAYDPGASTYWNNAVPTSTVFSLGNGSGNNGSGATYVAYCFAQIAGYSAFGSYTGNGSSDGPFVYTGFRPKFVMVKNTVDPNNWILFDTARNTYNIVDLQLYPNTSDAEVSGGSSNGIDFLSNGFKVRSSNNWGNRNGDTIIYACFAENPFKYANAR